MNKPVQVLLCYLAFLLILGSCQVNEHYERPVSLAPPMYQQLEEKGNFKHFLALVDKADYKQTLSEAGYFTLFAPTDAALEAYFLEEGIAGVEEMDAEKARAIVTYALVYNAYTVERLADYQSNVGWVEGEAYKRKTAYYDGVYKATNVKIGEEIVPEVNLVASNLHGDYILGDNGNKYIPYFTEEIFYAQDISAADYNYFYPNTTFTGFNVADARVVEANISAENGYIHTIDKVIEPLNNIDQQIAANDQYAAFRSILEEHLTTYNTQPEVSRRFNIMTGSTEPVYVKMYNPALVFSPNSEAWQDPLAGGSFYRNAAQANTNTIFVPKNEAVLEYVENVLLQYYPEGTEASKLPQHIFADFISAHMWAEPVWPTKFLETRNLFGDPARFDPEADILEKEILSNGLFYGTEKVLESNVFHSVYGRAYLDPKYTIMIDILGPQSRQQLTQRENLYTMFLVTDDAIQEAGFSYNSNSSWWEYTPPNGGATLDEGLARQRLERVIFQHVSMVDEMGDLADLSGEGLFRTYGGEYVRYENGKLYTAGNKDNGEVVNIVEGPIQTENGLVYLVDRTLEVSDKHMTRHIEEHFEDTYYYQYLKNSIIYDPVNYTMVGTTAGSPYTVLVPTDEAILAAVDAGLLPANEDGTPNFQPTSSTDQNLVAQFIRYHIITNEVLVDDPESDLFEVDYLTLYKDELGKTGTLFVSDGNRGEEPTAIIDMAGNTASVIRENSNILSNRAVIHQIDHYLDYRSL